MQFTRLRLQGFKSFVDPTELVIQDGLTGVVGPNGCGKSNLLEALRWVMGENRPSAMRGDGMEDVIFAGTDTRPARGRASVDLLIDNSERLAPAAFNTADTIEISRRITRDIGSAYTLNGKTVRARDVQMLFADASTGAHSPALVRQGQIGELINAKPRARRRILEEAAGISGLYQRRHEAELKLNAAEGNLARVDDVLDGLDTQLRSLERQAAQARRYREIAAGLREAEAVLLLVRWREAETARQAASTALADATREAARAEAEVLRATRAREEAAEAVPPLREEETVAAAVLQRVSIERGQLAEKVARAEDEIRALDARARQIAADLEREKTLGRDAGETLARLADEAATLRAQGEGQEDRQAAADEAVREAAEALRESETELDRLSEEAARLAARAQAAERRFEEARTAEAKVAAEIGRAEAAQSALRSEIAAARDTLEAAREAEAEARAAAEDTEAALAEAEFARAEAQEAEATARGAASEAEGALGAISAELRGIERLLARDRAEGEPMLDLVSVAPGYEAALGAALGDDLRLGLADGAASGWRDLAAPPAGATLPDGAEPLAAQVEAPAALHARLAQIGVVARADGARLQPHLASGQRLVSREGDLWRWDGFFLAAEDAPSAAALRLQQKNRLKALTAAEEEARDARDAAREAHEDRALRLSATVAAEKAARDARRTADQALGDAARLLSRAEAEIELRRGKLESADLTLSARREDHREARAALAEAETALGELGDLEGARNAVEVQRIAVGAARSRTMEARGAAEDIARAGRARHKRLADIAREDSGWRTRSETAGNRIAELERRAAETEEAGHRAAALPDALAAEAAKLETAIAAAETRRKAAADRLAGAETALAAADRTAREAEAAASSRREARARLDALAEAAAETAAEAAHRIRDELETDPQALADRLGPDLPTSADAEIEAAKLRRQRDALGAVNLRAEEDAREVQAERDTLAAEKADLDAAIAKLRGGIAELNREGRQRLLGAFESVNEKFARLFRHLFGGGEARLVMVEADDPLEAGLEILCQPPGKKLSTLSLLSGGEQTLTALSLIFAVFLSNPAPICVLDEVDAPLDDANVGRFCDLLDEMRRLTDTRFLVITHNPVTMSRMDRLFGVTMVERGVSQLVSVDLERAAELVEA